MAVSTVPARGARRDLVPQCRLPSPPVPRRYFCPACGGELFAHRGQIFCVDCPEFVPTPCQAPAVSRARS